MFHVEPTSVLLLPDWRPRIPGAGWLDAWADRPGHGVVEQHPTGQPLRGDWIMRLEEAVLASSGPVMLVGQGLGGHAVVAWAAHSRHRDRALGALLVEPNDPASTPLLRSWVGVPLAQLPFPAIVVADTAGPDSIQARHWAAAWGARFVPQAPQAGAWEAGYRLLVDLAGLEPGSACLTT